MTEAKTSNVIKYEALTPEVSLPWDLARIKFLEEDVLNDLPTAPRFNPDELSLINLRGTFLPKIVDAQEMFVRYSISELEAIPDESIGDLEATRQAIQIAYERTLGMLQSKGKIKIVPNDK